MLLWGRGAKDIFDSSSVFNIGEYKLRWQRAAARRLVSNAAGTKNHDLVGITLSVFVEQLPDHAIRVGDTGGHKDGEVVASRLEVSHLAPKKMGVNGERLAVLLLNNHPVINVGIIDAMVQLLRPTHSMRCDFARIHVRPDRRHPRAYVQNTVVLDVRWEIGARNVEWLVRRNERRRDRKYLNSTSRQDKKYYI
jgi:hypothetical protein